MVVLGLVLWVALTWHHADQTQKQDQVLATAVNDLESQFFYRHRSELEWIASRPEVQSFFRAPVLSSPVLALLELSRGLLNVEVVYLVDRRGRIIAATDPNFVGTDVSSRDYFRKTRSGLTGYSLASGLVRPSKALYAAVPAYGDGTIVGTVAFRTSATALQKWQEQYGPLVIINPSGDVFSASPSTPSHRTAGYRVSRRPLDVVPGFSVLLLSKEEVPWSWILLCSLVVAFLTVAGASVWYLRRLASERAETLRAQQQTELMFSHLMEGIAVFEAQGRMTWSNAAFDRLIQRQEGTSITLEELWEPGPGPWREVWEGRRPWVVFESALKGFRGAWIPVSAGFTQAEGRFLLSVLDGSEKYRTDQLLRQSQKLTVLGQLSGGIAHDLNNMLGVLMGMADLLKMSLPEQDPLQESVELILTTLARAASLSERMLAFARQTPIQRVPLDVTALLRELQFLTRTALPEGIRAGFDVDSGPVSIDGDGNLLLSAILNLVLNAAEAMAGGGEVRISGHRAEKNFEIRVQDNGKGMDKATLARIFEPFFSTKLDKKGTGLGLSLVRRTIVEHRGTIDVRSELGVGTLVIVKLPLTGS